MNVTNYIQLNYYIYPLAIEKNISMGKSTIYKWGIFQQAMIGHIWLPKQTRNET